MLPCPAIEEVERLPQGVSWGHVRGEGYGLLALVVVEPLRARHLGDGGQGGEAHHLAIGGLEIDAADVRDAVELGLVGPQVDVILLAPVHIGGLADAAEQGLKRARHGGDRNAELAGPLPLYGHLQLRGLLGVVEIRGQHQPALAGGLLQRQPLLIELPIVGALQHELHGGGGASPESGLEGADHHIRNAGQPPAQAAAKLGGGLVPHRPVGELDDDHAGLIAAAPEGRGAETHGLHHPLAEQRHDGGLHLLHVALHPLYAGALCPFHEHIDDTPVFGRGQAGGQLAKQDTDAPKAEQQHQRHPDGAAQHPAQQPAILCLHPAKAPIQRRRQGIGLVHGTHQPGAHGRSQGERHQGGEEHRER
ncbi:hypothetical protein D3C76_358390 [compost metagenome]